MGFDKDTRNRLSHFVANARTLLKEEVEDQLQAIYGIRLDGTIESTDTLTALDEPGLQLAHTLRERISYLARTHATEKTSEACIQKAIEQLAREQAFTVLNRLAAIRMAEKRNIVQESVAKGYQSRGFKVFESLTGSSLGEIYARYLQYIHCLFDELTLDLGMLFNRSSPQGILFPREPSLMPLLELFNSPDLETLWAEDETVGWIYQYYNDPAERKEMRDKSSAPRNSRELAVRNQFFTPRYVVEFLTDNTLGRIWYEMCQGQTNLKDRCRYLVRRPNEIFLKEGEAAPEQPKQENLSQEELLKQTVYIPHRQLKDPRTILMLDPACGSMHFGLYAFDLFEELYHEAWDREEQSKGALLRPKGMKSLQQSYADKTQFLADIPRLIIEHNIHGVDIDPRATQIAALSLWLRAHRTWNDQKTPLAQRPRITKSHIVCAEPMPGDPALLKEFVKASFPVPQQPLFQHLLEQLFEKMQLAGEAGSLLKIEEEITSAVEEAKAAWAKSAPASKELFGTAELNAARKPGSQGELPGIDTALIALDVTTDFWERIEERIYAALRDYAEQAENGGGFQRRLFAEDAARGFAFIDICKKLYDVALMNPPFGDASLPSKPYIEETFGDTRGDVYTAFVECFQARLVPAGFLGIISSRTGFFLGQSEDWRTRVVLRLFRPIALADLGMGVLDAMVEVAAYVLRSLSSSEARDLTLSLVPVLEKVVRDSQDRFSLPKWQAARAGLKRHQALAELQHLEAHGFIERCPGHVVRYAPLWKVVKAVSAPPEPVFPPFMCIRALAEDDKASVLSAAIRGAAKQKMFVCDPRKFSRLPGNTFAYWTSERIFALFDCLPSLAGSGRTVRTTNPTTDDFRFARVWWEPLHEDRERWRSWNKGGGFSPYYRDIEMVIDWDKERSTYRGYTGTIYRPDVRPANLEYFALPGLTWVYRGHRLCVQAMPAGTVISTRGNGIYAERSVSQFDLGLLNSTTADCLIKLTLGRGDHPQFDIGDVNTIPVPPIDSRVSQLATRAWAEKRDLDTSNEVSHAFVRPALASVSGKKLSERVGDWGARTRTSEQTVAAIQAEIDKLVLHSYGLDATDSDALAATLAPKSNADTSSEVSENEEESAATPDASALAADLLGYGLGCAFGRWNIRYATGEQAAPELHDPFAPLPVCPPGMLQNAQGLPARPEDVPASYPLKNIPWDGILVDDPNHPLDIEHRVREVIEIIWNGKEGGQNAEAIEHEACEILGVKSLRDYFRKPACFFADHLKRYSKSRRQAPIYWPLSTKSGSYTLWIYYHRLTDQTLHTCLIDFVIPKLKSIGNEIGNLRESKITGERLEALLELQEELSDFKAELEEIIKLPWKPNLNDGVIINAAPLWKLFRLPAWQKKLKATWDELTKGDYDWAHLAYTIWPERVKDACKSDRSMAIAHGLEHLCTIEAPKAKAKRKVKASSEDEAELDLFSNAPEIEEAEDSITIPPKGRKSTAKKSIAGEKVTRPRGRPAKAPKSDNPQGDK